MTRRTRLPRTGWKGPNRRSTTVDPRGTEMTRSSKGGMKHYCFRCGLAGKTLLCRHCERDLCLLCLVNGECTKRSPDGSHEPKT
jgi:hypothetical protein